MTDERADLVLELLQPIHARLDSMEADLGELKPRATALDEHMTGIFIALSGNNTRLDRLDERVKCIERRLDFSDVNDAR